MKTERMLRRKSAFSYVYLLLALASAILPLMINGPYLLNIVIWVASIFYVVHFYYGAIYYPNFYRKNLRRRWTFWRPAGDVSLGRGLISTLLVMVYFSYFVFILYEEPLLPAILKDHFTLWAFVWVGFNILLNQASQTSVYFNLRTASIDPVVFDPHGKYKDLRATICFYLPKGESEEKFSTQAVKAYLQFLDEEAKKK